MSRRLSTALRETVYVCRSSQIVQPALACMLLDVGHEKRFVHLLSHSLARSVAHSLAHSLARSLRIRSHAGSSEKSSSSSSSSSSNNNNNYNNTTISKSSSDERD